MPPRALIALVVAGVLSLVAIVIGALGQRGESEEAPRPATPTGRFEGGTMPRGVRAPDFTLRDQDGEPVRMRDLRGRPAVVTFLYTSCEESCPAQAQQIKGALDRLGAAVPALAISVEPERDTPRSARAFLNEQGMTGRMDFVLGSRAELARLWKGFAIQPQLPDAEHQARIVLVDRRGFQRVGFPAEEATPERLAHDLSLLGAESG